MVYCRQTSLTSPHPLVLEQALEPFFQPIKITIATTAIILLINAYLSVSELIVQFIYDLEILDKENFHHETIVAS